MKNEYVKDWKFSHQLRWHRRGGEGTALVEHMILYVRHSKCRRPGTDVSRTVKMETWRI